MDDRFAQPVDEFLAYVRIECGLSANTAEAYQHDLRRLVTDLIAHGIHSPRQIDMTALVNHLRRLRQDGLAPASISRHLSTIRMFCKFLAANAHIPENPAALLESPKLWRRMPDVMHIKQVQKILDAVDPDATHGRRDRAVLETMYATGCRASEIGQMTLDGYHRDLGVVRITGKGNKQRIVPVGLPAQHAIDDYLEYERPALTKPARPSDAIFLSRSGNPLDRIAVYNIVKKYGRRAGVRDVHPHMFRHSFATHLLGGGADLRVVQELLGHAKVTTTQIYTHVDQDRLKSVIDAFHPRP